MKKNTIILLTASMVFLFGCDVTKNNLDPQNYQTPQQVMPIDAKLNEPFKLRVRQTATIEEKNLSIKLSEVYIYGVICTKDGKCPPPDATANLEIQKGKETPELFQISTYDHKLKGKREVYEDQMKNGTAVTFGDQPNGKPIVYNGMTLSLLNVEISKPDNINKNVNVDSYRTPDSHYVFTFELK